jgi:glycosyltransferase involved in cell wall biosynthesis
MKILVFAPFYPPDPTGSSIFAEQQVRELVRQGHQVLVISNRIDGRAPNDPRLRTFEPGVSSNEVRRLRSFRLNLGKVTWNYSLPVSLFGFCSPSTRIALRNFCPDAVIVHSTLFDLSLLGLLWSARHKKRTVIVSHTALWHDNRVVDRAMKLYGYHILRRLVERSAARVVCVDKWTYDNAIGLFSHDGNTSTIPVSVELGTMHGGDAELIRRRHSLAEKPLILSLGHVVPLRDRINLIRALPLIVRKYPDVKVVIVGMVKDDRFLTLARKLGVEDKILVAGPVPHSEIRDYLAAADVEIHDLDGRGLGITSVEAMDAGVPIIAWATDDNYPQFSLRGYGPTGLIGDGNAESIMAALDRILTDENFRDEVKNSQRRLVHQIYSVESVTRQYLDLLEDECFWTEDQSMAGDFC